MLTASNVKSEILIFETASAKNGWRMSSWAVGNGQASADSGSSDGFLLGMGCLPKMKSSVSATFLEHLVD